MPFSNFRISFHSYIGPWNCQHTGNKATITNFRLLTSAVHPDRHDRLAYCLGQCHCVCSLKWTYSSPILLWYPWNIDIQHMIMKQSCPIIFEIFPITSTSPINVAQRSSYDFNNVKLVWNKQTSFVDIVTSMIQLHFDWTTISFVAVLVMAVCLICSKISIYTNFGWLIEHYLRFFSNKIGWTQPISSSLVLYYIIGLICSEIRIYFPLLTWVQLKKSHKCHIEV